MNLFLFTILVFISPNLSETQDLLLPFPTLRSIFSKLKKRQGDGGYLEQCGVVDFGERNLRSVNVLAFFDASWQYSHRQAAMLKELKGRFERSGMRDIKFFVINSLPETIMGEAEMEIEEETWKAISPSEAEGFPLVKTSLGFLNETLGPEFYLIEDKPQLLIWKKLHVSRDQILVVDGCGKLTYQVIVPWSILHFPYVKAAILSTYKDEPCGPCKQEKLESKSTFYEPVNDAEFTTIGHGSDVPKGIMEEVEREEVMTEIKKDELTKTLSEIEESTTEEMETRDFFRIVSLKMGETTVELMKTEGTTTEQIKTDGTMLVPLEIEGSTTEEMETTYFLGKIPLQIMETTTEQINTDVTMLVTLEVEDSTEKMDQTTIEQIKRDETTREQIKTDGTMLVPLEIEDSTTEETKITNFFREIPSKMDETTIEQMKTDEVTTEQIKTDETTVEQMKTDGTTIEQIKTDRTILVSLGIEDSTTEEMDSTDFWDKIPFQIDQTTIEQTKRDRTTTEQTKTDRTILVPLEIEDSTTEETKITNFLREIPSKMDETTIEQMKTDETTVEQMKTDGTTTEQIKTDRTILIPLEIEDSTTEQMETTDFIWTMLLQRVEIATEQIKTVETTTEQTKTDATTPLFQLEETTEHIKTTDTEFSATTIEKPFMEEKIVDYPISNNYQEKDTKSEKQKPEKTLKPNLNLENDNSEDSEHILSKFPNVRSISTESDKNTFLDQNFEKGSDENEENANLVPIRIIMKAPHFDIYENSLIKHDYLVLKTGNPDLHDHLDRGIKIESLDENSNLEEGSADFENWADIWKIEGHDLNQNEDKINNDNENNNRTKNGWYGFRIKIDNDNKDSRKIKKRIFGKDESPGLYGEVADYWRNDGIENFYDEAFDNEDDKIYDMEKDSSDNAENSYNVTEEKLESEGQKESIGNSLNNEEDAKSKLIAHYSKLLPWIYYVLN